MEFLGQAIEILKVLVIALGGALVFQETFKRKAGAWGIICKAKKENVKLLWCKEECGSYFVSEGSERKHQC